MKPWVTHLGSSTFLPSRLHLESLTALSTIVQSPAYRVIIFPLGSELLILESKDCGFFLFLFFFSQSSRPSTVPNHRVDS